MKTAAAEFFESLLPALEENIRNHEMLVPVFIIRSTSGREFVQDMSRFFSEGKPHRKDAIVPLVSALFTNDQVLMIAFISECWVAKMRGKTEDEVHEELDAVGGSVSGLDHKVDGVIVHIYGRDGSDELFSLIIKPGRTGVVRADYDGSTYTGRFKRDDPKDN